MEISPKQEIIAFCRKLYQKGFVANHDGNITVKADSKIWATPTAQSKGDVTENMLVLLDEEGRKIEGQYNVFSEINLHLACYRIRNDINAVVHAHPPVASAFACCGIELEKIFIAEAVVTLGERIPLVPFVPPDSLETETILQHSLLRADVLLLQNHGLLSVGKNLSQAYYRLELVEQLAKIQWYSKSIGNIKALPEVTVQELLEKRKKTGLAFQNQLRKSKLKKIIEEEVSRYLSANSL